MTQEGQAVTVSGNFADPRTNETDVVTIVWGDGSADTTVDLAPGVRSFSAAHAYTAEGDFFPVVVVANADGPTAAAASAEQAPPAPFRDVLILQGQPGQHGFGAPSTDPVTGDVIAVSFTVAPAHEASAGSCWAAQLANVSLSPTAGVLETLATYDFRQQYSWVTGLRTGCLELSGRPGL